MRTNTVICSALAGLCAGSVTGLFGAGGGMVLIPLLTALTDIEDRALFTTSLFIMLPVCLVSIVVGVYDGALPWKTALPYLYAGAAGGLLAGLFGKKIPTKWLHRGLGLMILWGGIRYLC